jgi:multidrug efflux system membrane fusion protein
MHFILSRATSRFSGLFRGFRTSPTVAVNPGLFAVLILTLGLPLTGCADKDKGARRNAGGAAPVHVAQVEHRVVPLTLDAIGAVEPSRTASVRSQVTGTLQKIDFREGQDVKIGDLLFEIDPRPFQNALQSAEADLQRARVQLENAKSQSERYRSLNTESAISKEQFQTIEDNERTAAAQVLSGEAAVANARLQLEYCSIRAPIAGRTGSYGAHEGDLISSGNSTPLVVINQLSPTYVTFSVPQQYLGELTRYREAGPVAVTATPPGNDPPHEGGELIFIDNVVDMATGTLRLKATFPNTSRNLWPGQFATVRITLASPDVVCIPSAAVQSDQQGHHVFVVKPDKTAEYRPITVERTVGNTAVISKGVNPGETIVIDGQLRVVPGKPVDVRPAESMADNGNSPSSHGPAINDSVSKAP